LTSFIIIVRGNQKQRIFKDQVDCQKYLLTLAISPSFHVIP